MIEIAVITLTCLVGVGVSVLLAGVPWAFSVHGRLTRIETSLQHYLMQSARITRLERCLSRLLARRRKERSSHA